jgi:hypothetical protein
VTRELLPKAIERARSGAIGAGIATAVTAALVAASVGLYVNAEESLAPTHYSPAVQQQAAAGVALLSLSVVALNVSVSVLASELGNLGSLRRTARRLTAASIAPKPLPWVSRDAGGIALAGRF